MELVMDPVLVFNIALCAVIVILGYWAHARKKEDWSLFISMAFALFGVSHIISLTGHAADLLAALLAIRTIAYILMAFALYRYIKG